MNRRRTAIGLALLACGISAGQARGDDLVTRSGVVYHRAIPMRAEPDGVIWLHDGGLVKVDFADSPENVRRAYHYDPAKATAYRDTQAKVRQQAAEQAQRLREVLDARRAARAQAAVSQVTTSNDSGTEMAITLRRASSPASSDSIRALAAQMQADADKRAAKAADSSSSIFSSDGPGTLIQRLINRFEDTTSAFRINNFHSAFGDRHNGVIPPAGLLNTSIDDPFFGAPPVTSYEEERAKAFARGVPMKDWSF